MSLRLGDEDSLSEVHEINMTPFIDVMLVLLIIFMIAAPLATVDIPVDLPASSALPAPHPQQPLYLSIKNDGRLYIGEQLIAPSELTAALADASAGNHDEPVFIRGDQQVAYRELIALMDRLREAGYLKIGLVGLEASAQP